MENATKALLIGAAILIAIVVITLGVFILGKGSALVKENSDMSEVEISTFNSKFEGFCGKNVRGAQVQQLIKAVNQNNKTNEDDSSKQIILTDENGIGIGSDKTKYDASKIGTGYAYDVTPEYGTGSLLNEIKITKK